MHVNAFYAQETIGNGTACVAGGGHQDMHQVISFSLFPDKIAQHA